MDDKFWVSVELITSKFKNNNGQDTGTVDANQGGGTATVENDEGHSLSTSEFDFDHVSENEECKVRVNPVLSS